MEARYYRTYGDRLQCRLCPHNCVIREGNSGICKVRTNRSGKLVSDNYGSLSAVHLDPVEKKPLYHFYPGRYVLSVGSTGCNMHCSCCQNWQISQASTGDFQSGEVYRPEHLVDLARSKENNIGIAYTYNEPTVWFEFMLDTAKLVTAEGLKNVVVSNGYINEEPLLELMQYADAFNIDLKAFSEGFYRKITGAHLDPVLHTLRTIREYGKHLEVTCLVIPSLNDDAAVFRDMTAWLSRETGRETVLHLSRYHPAYRMDLGATPARTLDKLYDIASETLDYVYVGNVNLKDFQDTKCSRCGKTVVRRTGYHVERSMLTGTGHCAHCGNKITIS